MKSTLENSLKDAIIIIKHFGKGVNLFYVSHRLLCRTVKGKLWTKQILAENEEELRI